MDTRILYTVYLGWLDQESSDVNRATPIKFLYYVIEMGIIKKENHSVTNASYEVEEWLLLGKILVKKIKIDLKPGYSYVFRITPISVEGILDKSRESKPIFLAKESNSSQNEVELGPPKDLKILNYIYRSNLTVDAVVTWKSSKYKSCYYTFFWYPQNHLKNSNDYKSQRIEIPGQKTMILNNLSYGASYMMEGRSNSRDWREESLPFQFKMNTPSCLTLTFYDFDRCAPAITNINLQFFFNQKSNLNPAKTYKIINSNGTIPMILKTTQGLVTLFMNWDIPGNINNNNKIKKITLKLENMDMVFDDNIENSIIRNIYGNLTSYSLDALDSNSSYCVEFILVSMGGQSQFSKCFRTPELKFEGQILEMIKHKRQIQTHGLLYKVLIFMAALFAALVLFIGLWITKRNMLCRISTSKRCRNKKVDIFPMQSNPFYNFTTNDKNRLINSKSVEKYWSNLSSMYKSLISEECHLSNSVKHIAWEKINLTQQIGCGAFGKVFKGDLYYDMNKNKMTIKQIKADFGISKIDCAVKILKEFHNDDDMRSFLEEIWTLAIIGDHPNIVNLIGYSCNHSLAAVMEYCELGSMYSYLRQFSNINTHINRGNISSYLYFNDLELKPDKPTKYDHVRKARYSEMSGDSGMSLDGNSSIKPTTDDNEDLNRMIPGPNGSTKPESHLDMKDIMSFTHQIATGMEFLASKRMIHRDLAARNILVCLNKVVKISDFGLARDIYDKTTYLKQSNGKVPIKWMAPESLIHNVYTSLSDVWSFGILLWEIITLGATPYPGIEYANLANRLLGGYRMLKPIQCPDYLYEIMLNCWQLDPQARPEFSKLRNSIEDIITAYSNQEYCCEII
ncbi:unnamed protein product [Gordionus sp. m RMFG-2023]